jgi:hypothetical protein
MVKETFKERDWVVITKSDKNWNYKMDKFIGKCVQIKSFFENKVIFTEESASKNLRSWNWGEKWEHFRHALPHEIPGNNVLNTLELW